MNQWVSWVIGCCFGAILVGCTMQSNMALSHSQRPYDFESHTLHPRGVAIPGSTDSVDVFFDVTRKECLYLRESPQSPFVSQLECTVGAHRFTWVDTLVSGASRWNRKHVRLDWHEVFPEWAGQLVEEIPLSITDLQRNVRHAWTTDVLTKEASLPAYHSDGWPLNTKHAVVGDTLYFSSPTGSTWHHASAAVPATLPSPPFSHIKDRSDTLEPLIRSTIVSGNSRWNSYIVQPGVNIIADANSAEPRIVQRVYGTQFPFDQVRDLRVMIQSCRYITSRKEYERMVASEDSKAALDAFWLNCANEKERAAQMISTYYGRVEEANRYFSGVLEGWRTDRGMVHIVFGIPTKIRKTGGSEWWIYGEEGSANAITFRFMRTQHPWDDQFFRMSRNIQYRTTWDRMVTNWRNGRIQPD